MPPSEVPHRGAAGPKHDSVTEDENRAGAAPQHVQHVALGPGHPRSPRPSTVVLAQRRGLLPANRALSEPSRASLSYVKSNSAARRTSPSPPKTVELGAVTGPPPARPIQTRRGAPGRDAWGLRRVREQCGGASPSEAASPEGPGAKARRRLCCLLADNADNTDKPLALQGL